MKQSGKISEYSDLKLTIKRFLIMHFTKCISPDCIIIKHRNSIDNLCSLCIMTQGKGKVHPRTGHEAQRGSRCKLYSIFNLGARWGGWLTPCSGYFTPGKTRYPLYRRLGGPQGRSGWGRKISPPPGFDSLAFQSVASRYTD